MGISPAGNKIEEIANRLACLLQSKAGEGTMGGETEIGMSLPWGCKRNLDTLDHTRSSSTHLTQYSISTLDLAG